MDLLESHISQIAAMPVVQQRLRERFGSAAGATLERFLAGTVEAADFAAYDVVQELAEEEAETVMEWTGYGSAGEFPITVSRFGPIYWVRAPEFDTSYFDNEDDARYHGYDIYLAFAIGPEDEDEDEEEEEVEPAEPVETSRLSLMERAKADGRWIEPVYEDQSLIIPVGPSASPPDEPVPRARYATVEEALEEIDAGWTAFYEEALRRARDGKAASDSAPNLEEADE
ncbi:hypothetical protein EON82_21205 [bacterium]|nr:MAG: hypothetical protein EON82_21205 [bacterium]